MPPKGNIYIEKAIKLGIPKNAISNTRKVFNTADESSAIKEILNQKIPQPKILLVTSAFHMKRAKREFERNGFIVGPFPADFKAKSYSNYAI